LNIIVEDDGKGFDKGKVTDKNGMGLDSINKRIESLGGSVSIDSYIGKGSTITIDIPLV